MTGLVATVRTWDGSAQAKIHFEDVPEIGDVVRLRRFGPRLAGRFEVLGVEYLPRQNDVAIIVGAV